MSVTSSVMQPFVTDVSLSHYLSLPTTIPLVHVYEFFGLYIAVALDFVPWVVSVCYSLQFRTKFGALFLTFLEF